jgi:hypothetical protein
MAKLTPHEVLKIEMEMALCGLFPVEGYGMVHLPGDIWKPAELWLATEPANLELRVM